MKMFERLHQPGGFVHTFTRKGFTFEASTHSLSGFDHPMYLKQILSLLKLDNLPLKEHEYSIEAIRFDKKEIESRFLIGPGKKNINQFFKENFKDHLQDAKLILNEISMLSDDLLRIKRLQRVNPFRYPLDLLALLCLKSSNKSDLLKNLAKMKYSHIMKYKDKSANALFSLTENKKLRYIFSVLCVFFGIQPAQCPALILSVFIHIFFINTPKSIVGGTSTLISRLVDGITDYGGTIDYRKKVSRIIIKDGKASGVELENGDKYFADKIITNNTAHNTFTELVPDSQRYLSSEYSGKIADYILSASAFQLYLGLPFSIEDYGFKSETTLFTNSYDLDDAIHPNNVPDEETSFLITNYKKTNPEFYNEGKSGIVITEYNRIDKWISLSKEKYKTEKDRITTMIINKVSRITGILLQKAELKLAGTPKTLSFYSGEKFGSVVGAATNLKQGALNRFDNVTPIKNLFLVGSDTKPAGGVGSCLDSGIITGRSVLKD